MEVSKLITTPTDKIMGFNNVQNSLYLFNDKHLFYSHIICMMSVEYVCYIFVAHCYAVAIS